MAQESLSTTVPSEGTGRKSTKLNVFISYSRHDIAFVDLLQAKLAEHGIEAFVDREHIEKGEAWWERLKQLITEADTVVFVLSPDSVGSKVCQDEVDFAESLNKRFVPIVARDLDGRSVPAALARLNYVFFIPNAGARGDLDTAVGELIHALETDILWIREHTRLGSFAERWVAKNRPRDLLLQGGELKLAEQWLVTRPANGPDPTSNQLAFITASRQATTKRQRVVNYLSTGAALVATVLLGLATWQWERAATNEALARHQEQLAKNNEKKAVEERDGALLSESRFLRRLADQQMKTGNVRNTFRLLDLALPATIERPDRPLFLPALASARKALFASKFLGRVGKSEQFFTALAAEKTGSPIYLGTRTGALFEFDRNSQDIKPVGEFAAEVEALYTSQSGNVIAALSDTKTLLIYDRRAGRIVYTFDAESAAIQYGDSTAQISSFPSHRIRDVEFLNNDSALVAVSENGRAFVIDLVSPSVKFKLTGHSYRVTSVDISPDQTKIATGSDDGTTIIWDASTGGRLSVLIDPLASFKSGQPDSTGRLSRISSVKHVEFTSDSRRVLTAEWGGMAREDSAMSVALIWDLATSTVETRLPMEGFVRLAQLVNDDREVVTSDESGRLLWWDLASGKAIAVLQHGAAAISGLRVNKNFAVGYDLLGNVYGWSIAEPIAFAIDRRPLFVQSVGIPIHALGLVADENYILTLDRSGAASAWTLRTPAVARHLHSGNAKGRATRVTFSRDGSVLASGYVDGTIAIDRMKGDNWEALQRFKYDGEIADLQVFSERDTIWIQEKSGAIDARRLSSGNRMGSYPIATTGATTFAVDPGGETIWIGYADGRIEKRSTVTGESDKAGSIALGAGIVHIGLNTHNDLLTATTQAGAAIAIGYHKEGEVWKLAYRTPFMTFKEQEKLISTDFERSDRFLLVVGNSTIYLLTRDPYSQVEPIITYKLSYTLQRKGVEQAFFHPDFSIPERPWLVIRSAAGLEVYDLGKRDIVFENADLRSASVAVSVTGDLALPTLDQAGLYVARLPLEEGATLKVLRQQASNFPTLTAEEKCEFLAVPPSECTRIIGRLVNPEASPAEKQ